MAATESKNNSEPRRGLFARQASYKSSRFGLKRAASSRRGLGETSSSHRSLSPTRDLHQGQTNSDAQSVKSTRSFFSKKSIQSSRSPWRPGSRSSPINQSLDLTDQTIDINPRVTISDRPGLGEKAMSVQSLLGTSDPSLVKPQTPTEAFQLYNTEAPIFPTLKDYREALSAFLVDISHTFLSLLAVLDIVFRPLLLLVWFAIQFVAYRVHYYALCCLDGKQTPNGGVDNKTEKKPSRGLKRSTSSRRALMKSEATEMIR